MAGDSSTLGNLDARGESAMHGDTHDFQERRTMSRWEFRADQIQVLNQQAQTELIISILVAGIVSAVFWSLAPPQLLLGWSVAIVVGVGLRALLINVRNSDDKLDSINVWGKQYVTGAAISGAWPIVA